MELQHKALDDLKVRIEGYLSYLWTETVGRAGGGSLVETKELGATALRALVWVCQWDCSEISCMSDSFHTATHINTKYPKRTILLGKLYFHNHSLRSRRDRLREEIFRAEELRRRAENWAGGRRFEIPRSYLAVIRRSLLSAKLCKSGGIAAKTFARATIIPPGTQATTVIAICLQFHNQLLTIAAKRQSSASATRRPI